MKTKALDLGCGLQPNNLFNQDEAYGIDIRENSAYNVLSADLAISPIPFPDNYFDRVTALDFIEHIPRVIYNPNIRFCFVELMNEIYRVLKPEGYFYSRTPAFPASSVFSDPTHVNIITVDTFPFYFDDVNRYSAMYGFTGYFKIEEQIWHDNKIHLGTMMKKVLPSC